MSILSKVRRWCPQPKITVPTINHVRISKSLFAFALAAEILILLVAPIAYYMLVSPKPQTVIDQQFPLTNDEIKTAWPNLPTAEQIVHNASLTPYFGVNPSCTLTYDVTNCTVLNLPNYFSGGLVAKSYHIWLKYNDDWIQVPLEYLTTSNPPMVPSEQTGFLGSGLPTAYVILAIIVIVATLTVGTSLVVRKRKTLSSN